MPYTFIPPEPFLRYQGVTIYYLDEGDGPATYAYTPGAYQNDHETLAFDVRDLPVPDAADPEDHAALIRAALDAGLISLPDYAPDNDKPARSFTFRVVRSEETADAVATYTLLNEQGHPVDHMQDIPVAELLAYLETVLTPGDAA